MQQKSHKKPEYPLTLHKFFGLMAKKRSLLSAILGMKCPNCREGNMFLNKSIFPLKNMMEMPKTCPVCQQKMELELGFYYGTGYVSYGLSVAVAIFNFIWYALLVGFSWKDNSVYWYLGITFGMLILIQPWMMRLSRVLYLNMFVKYQSKEQKDLEAQAEKEAGY